MNQRSEVFLSPLCFMLFWGHPSTHTRAHTWTACAGSLCTCNTPKHQCHLLLTVHTHHLLCTKTLLMSQMQMPESYPQKPVSKPTCYLLHSCMQESWQAQASLRLLLATHACGPQSAHTHVCADLNLPLTGWLTALRHTQKFCSCNLPTDWYTQKCLCSLKTATPFLKATSTGLAQVLMQVSEHSHFLCKYTIYDVQVHRACYIHAAPWIYTGNH